MPFFERPLRVWIYLLRNGAYRDFLHLKAHTISNKLVSKVFAQKKRKKVMAATICVQILVVSGEVSPSLNSDILFIKYFSRIFGGKTFA